jgi:YggT family protein
MTAAAFVLATARDDIAGYVNALVNVYILLIIAYILSSLFLAFGGRVPYARWSSAILGFLRDVCEPYLALFRRFIPSFGPLDFSPVVAIIALRIVGSVVVNLIQG